MTPEEIAMMQAGVDPRAYYGQDYRLLEQARRGELPAEFLQNRGATPMGPRPTPDAFAARAREEIKQKLGGAKQAGKEVLEQGGQFVQGLANKPGLGRAAFLGGLIPGVLAAGSELQEGRPLGAAAALGAGTLTSGLGTALLKAPHPFAKLAGGALMLGGMVIPGMVAQGAESVRQDVTGKPTKGKEGDFSTQMAMNRQLAELGMTQYRDQSGVDVSATKDLTQFYSNQAYTDLQRNIPLINQMKNADLVRQQALMNTQGQQNARMGILATAAQLATGAQSNNAAIIATALQSNPFAGGTLEAPAIRFG